MRAELLAFAKETPKMDRPELYAVVLFNRFRFNMTWKEEAEEASKAAKELKLKFPSSKVVHLEERNYHYGEREPETRGQIQQ